MHTVINADRLPIKTRINDISREGRIGVPKFGPEL